MSKSISSIIFSLYEDFIKLKINLGSNIYILFSNWHIYIKYN